MENDSGNCAVIYTRVSDTKQKTHGDGLRSQETRCREYATMKGYQVAEVFQDDISGKDRARPGMEKMLTWLRRNRKEAPVVIIDDINRWARDTFVHWMFRESIAEAGATLESPSIEFGETSSARFHENIMASAAQYQREQNAEQVKNRMRSRLMNGYWVFPAPVGYTYLRKPGHGKVLVRDEPVASIVQEALEGFACGRFQTQAELKRFLQSKPEFPRYGSTGYVHWQTVDNMVTRKLYTGMIEMPEWGVSLREGHHEGLIGMETYSKIQVRLKQKAYFSHRKDAQEDFPLRGSVCCSDCGALYTAGWSKGRHRDYAYYSCRSKGCPSYGKSIRREEIEGDFEKLLRKSVPAPEFQALLTRMFTKHWDHHCGQLKRARGSLKEQISRLDQQVSGLLHRIVDASTESVIKAYEKRVHDLEMEKLVLQEKLASTGKSSGTFRQKFEPALDFLKNPQNLWRTGRLEDRKTVLKLTFASHLIYCRETGFRTAELSLPFKVLGCSHDGDSQMVELDAKTLNLIADEMTDWTAQLKHCETPLKELRNAA